MNQETQAEFYIKPIKRNYFHYTKLIFDRMMYYYLIRKNMLRSQIFTKLTVHRVVCYTPKQIPSLLKVTFDRMIQLAIHEDFFASVSNFQENASSRHCLLHAKANNFIMKS